jgi:hypothetical protein
MSRRRRRVDPADLVEAVCMLLCCACALAFAYWGGLVL